MVIAPVRELDEIGAGGLRTRPALGRSGARLASLAVQVGERIERGHGPEGLAIIILDACGGAGVRVHHQLHRLAGEFIGPSSGYGPWALSLTNSYQPKPKVAILNH